MRKLTPCDFQQIDTEIVGMIGKCSRREQLDRLRSLAEIHRVYASRAALMVREIQDEWRYR